MVLIALAIVFAGLGAMSLSSSDSEGTDSASGPEATTTASVVATQANTPPPTTTATADAPTTTTTTTAAVDKSVPVRVYNNSDIQGLAATTASQLRESGWSIAETGNYASGVIPKTTVYYGSSAGERAAAMAIAAELGATAEPRFPGIADSPAGVIVIVTRN
ncbi:LytR C-terminal domain-containing protein [Nocardia otitidiscaviarum]|nr:LytR C-terminal domain-containing protein [Nocardia otitidiscaviarum]MBF6241658.1 LytR C-terminal domain-containing protein [Nocardia otitidiscaviarum]